MRAAARTPRVPARSDPTAGPSPRTPAPVIAGPWRRRRVVSLRVVVPLASVVMLAAALLAGALFWERQTRSLLARESGTRLVAEARQLALASAGALLEPFPELSLQPIVRDLLADRPEIQDVAVLDHDGSLVGSGSPDRLRASYRMPSGTTPRAIPVRLRPGEQMLESGTRLIVVAPVLHSSGQRLGTAVLTVRRDYLERALADARRRMWRLLAFLLPLGGILTLLVIGYMLRPLKALRAGLERIGQGHLDTRIEPRGRTEIGLLAETVNAMAGRLSHAQREALERERLQGELDVAGRIQRLLLPAGAIEVGGYRIAGMQRPAAQVGGDYFDAFRLPGDRVGLAVADVSGKGVGGCLVMAMLSAQLRALCQSVESPSELLLLLERQFPPSLRHVHFVTFWYGILDPATGVVRFASAGHLPALVYRAASRSVGWRKGTGVPLGLLREEQFRSSIRDDELELGPGDLLVQFTDGFSEASSPGGGEEFGFERIAAAVCEASARGPDGVLARLRDDVREWSGADSPDDDQTMLVVGSRAGEARATAPAPVSTTETAEDLPSLLDRGRREGRCLEFRTRMEQLDELRGWLQATPELGTLEGEALPLVEAALYEMCANVMEHGYRGRPDERFELWWIPGADGPGAPPGDTASRERVRRGCFVIVDHGESFDPASWPSPDLSDPNVRLRGRGFGVEMVRRIMSGVSSYPGTPFGNVTILRFDPWQSAVRC